MTLTRDSIIWLIGMVGSALVAVSTNLHLFPWMSPTAQHWINLAAFVVGIISGKMATSPLMHSQEVKEVKAYQERSERLIPPASGQQ